MTNPRTVLELRGPPSSGKTHLLYFFLILCVIPENHQDIRLGGSDKAAIVFDMDLSFDVIRFNQLLDGHLLSLLPSDKSAASSIARRSLQRLHIFRPDSSLQLAATLSQLAKYHAFCLPGEKIGLLAIDSVNANYWPDRFTLEQTRASTPNKRRVVPSLQHILMAAEPLRRSCGFTTVITNRIQSLPDGDVGCSLNLRDVSPVGVFTSLAASTPVLTLSLCGSHRLEKDEGTAHRAHGLIQTSEKRTFIFDIFEDHLTVE